MENGIKYNANIIDEALEKYVTAINTYNSWVEETKATSSPKDITPQKIEWTHLSNNCQVFIQDILKIAEDLAFQQGEELIFSEER